jgi:hypothetical protein
MAVRPIVLVSAGLAACSGGGAAAVDAPTADAVPRQVVTDSRLILAHDLVEAILTGGPGDRAVLHLVAPDPKLDWNIHGHANGGTQNVAEGFAQLVVDYDFAPTAQADWYLLLRNQGDAPLSVDVELELYGQIAWSGWQ